MSSLPPNATGSSSFLIPASVAQPSLAWSVILFSLLNCCLLYQQLFIHSIQVFDMCFILLVGAFRILEANSTT